MNVSDTTKQSSPKPQYLSPRETAKLLGICEKTLWTLTKRGEIPGWFKVGRSVRYSLDHIRAWIESRAGKSPEQPQ